MISLAIALQQSFVLPFAQEKTKASGDVGGDRSIVVLVTLVDIFLIIFIVPILQEESFQMRS